MILQLLVSFILLYLGTTQAGTPSIDRCPGTIFRQVASSDATVSVRWDEPDCGSNSQSTHSQGFEFGPGVHTVVYWFASGSMSNTNGRCCSFDVFVSGPEFDLCTQNLCSGGEVCVPEIDRFYCYPGNTNIKIHNCSQTVILRTMDADSVTGQWVEPTAFDHYGQLLPPSTQSQISPGSSLSVGEYDISYTFTDRGNSKTCSFKVIVAQNTGPGFQNCPEDITVISSKSTVRVDWLEPLLQPNEDRSRIDVTQTHSPGQIFPVPSFTTVNYTFTDRESGRSSSCIFQITTETMVSVTVQQPANRFVRILQSNQNPQAWPRPSYSRTGNADRIPLVIIPSRGHPGTNPSMYPKGFFPITFNVTDIDGNGFGSTNFIVTIHNNGQQSALSVRQCSGDENVNSEVPTMVNWDVPYVEGNEIDLVWTEGPDVRPNQDTLLLGEHVLQYLFYSPESQTALAECRFTVSLTDITPPTIPYCPASITRTARSGTSLSVDFPRFLAAIDEPDGRIILSTPSVNPPLLVSAGTSQLITYTFTDGYGNSDNCDLEITVTVEEEPAAAITNCLNRTRVASEDMQGLQLDIIEYPVAVRESGAQSSPASLSQHFFIVNTKTTVRATFPSLTGVPFIGDRICTFNVIVLDDIPPLVSNCSQEMSVSSVKGAKFVRVNWTEPTSVDSLEGGKLINRTHAPLDPFPVGETTVVWYLFEDEAGLQTYCSINITVREAPLEQCPSNLCESSDDPEIFSLTFETIVVIVVTAVATFVFSLTIFLLSLCCCTCCCVVDTANESRPHNDSSSEEVRRTRLFVKVGSRNFSVYGAVTPLATNSDDGVERKIDDDEFADGTSGATFNRAYQNEAPKSPPAFGNNHSPTTQGNDYDTGFGVQGDLTPPPNGRIIDEASENDVYGYDNTPGDAGVPPRPPAKPGKKEKASKLVGRQTLLDMQAAVQSIKEEKSWRTVDDGEVYGFDKPPV